MGFFFAIIELIKIQNMSTLSRIQATQSLFKVAEIDQDRLQIQCTVLTKAHPLNDLRIYIYRGNWYKGSLQIVNWFKETRLQPASDMNLDATNGLHLLWLTWEEFDLMVSENDLKPIDPTDQQILYFMHYSRKNLYNAWRPADIPEQSYLAGEEAYPNFYKGSR